MPTRATLLPVHSSFLLPDSVSPLHLVINCLCPPSSPPTCFRVTAKAPVPFFDNLLHGTFSHTPALLPTAAEKITFVVNLFSKALHAKRHTGSKCSCPHFLCTRCGRWPHFMLEAGIQSLPESISPLRLIFFKDLNANRTVQKSSIFFCMGYYQLLIN